MFGSHRSLLARHIGPLLDLDYVTPASRRGEK